MLVILNNYSLSVGALSGVVAEADLLLMDFK